MREQDRDISNKSTLVAVGQQVNVSGADGELERSAS
jgi:hypothetical protein